MNQVDQLLYSLAAMNVPFLNKSIEELGLKYQIETSRGIKLQFTAGFPVQTIKEDLLQLLKQTAQGILPETAIEIDLQSKIQGHRTQMSGKGLRAVKNVIAVASGKGGLASQRLRLIWLLPLPEPVRGSVSSMQIFMVQASP